MRIKSLIDSKNYFVDIIDSSTQQTPKGTRAIDCRFPATFDYQIPTKFKWTGNNWNYEGTLEQEKEYCKKMGIIHPTEKEEPPSTNDNKQETMENAIFELAELVAAQEEAIFELAERMEEK